LASCHSAARQLVGMLRRAYPGRVKDGLEEAALAATWNRVARILAEAVTGRRGAGQALRIPGNSAVSLRCFLGAAHAGSPDTRRTRHEHGGVPARPRMAVDLRVAGDELAEARDDGEGVEVVDLPAATRGQAVNTNIGPVSAVSQAHRNLSRATEPGGALAGHGATFNPFPLYLHDIRPPPAKVRRGRVKGDWATFDPFPSACTTSGRPRRPRRRQAYLPKYAC
jgi:hypothetical protein